MLYCLLPLHHLPCQFSTLVPQPGWRKSPAVWPGRLPPIHGIQCRTAAPTQKNPLSSHNSQPLSVPLKLSIGLAQPLWLLYSVRLLPKVPLPIPIIGEEGEQKATGPGMRHSGFACGLCNSLHVWLGKSSSACLCCSFLICKVGVMMLLSVIVRIKSRILE